MFLIKLAITIVLAANLGDNFPVDRLKLPSTYDEPCPPGNERCTAEAHENLPEPTRRGNLTTTFANTTSENITEMPTTAPSLPSNHSTAGEHRTTNSASGVNVAGKGHITGRKHPCPIGIWVCRRKRALKRIKKSIRDEAAHREFAFAKIQQT